ncbi:hypothetical protein D9M72_596350 [compost metagenome]
MEPVCAGDRAGPGSPCAVRGHNGGRAGGPFDLDLEDDIGIFANEESDGVVPRLEQGCHVPGPVQGPHPAVGRLCLEFGVAHLLPVGGQFINAPGQRCRLEAAVTLIVRGALEGAPA